MAATAKQRTLVWLGVLAFIVYIMALSWHGWRYGFSTTPWDGLFLLLLVIGVARNLYWPPRPRPRWVEVLCWAVISPLLLYSAVLELRLPLGWTSHIWSVLMIVLVGVWGYSILHPDGKLWRAFHPGEWGTRREDQRR